MTDLGDDAVMLAEERLRLDRRRVPKARIRLSTVTEERVESATLDLTTETVEVTRIPANRPVDEAPPIVTEDDLTIIPIVEERMVLRRQLVVTGEIHIRKHRTQREVSVPTTLRRQVATVERHDLSTGLTTTRTLNSRIEP